VDTALGMVVADDGTAPRARIPGFRVAGKTGTAQKFDFKKKSYSHSKYWASFVGYVDPPAGQSRKVVYVMVDEPKKSIYGGMVAAPAFRNINRRLISYLNYVPNSNVVKFGAAVPVKKSCSCGPAVENAQTAPKNKGCVGSAAGSGQLALVVPDFTGQTIREALARIGSYRNRVKISGHGRIIAQEPAPGSRLEPGIDFVFTLSGEI